MNRPVPTVPVECAHWRELPLAGDGRCLVEASAGTGKTWTIAALYLRLLLECGHGAREVVVATFSKPAAQELRERIRVRLLEAAALAGGFDEDAPPRDDDGTRWLHARWSAMDAAARTIDRHRLALALAELDLAPIGTLHSLCHRILAEHPFDSGSAFEAGEAVDGSELDAELRTDLWRRLAQSDADRLDAGDRAWFAAGRPRLDEALKAVCAPGVGVRPIDPDTLGRRMDSLQGGAIRAWALQAAMQPRKRKLRERLLQLADFVDAGDPDAPLPDIVDEAFDDLLADQLRPEELDAARAHPLVRELHRLVNLLRCRGAPVRAAALARYCSDLLAARERRLRDRGQLTFDAQIERTLAALEAPTGAALAARLREDWPVALVDEFQDTDARQYAVLDRIFRGDDGAVRGRVVMIGDPKQAIYGFRGGDVQAYLDASATATHVLRIATNYRSSRALVGALNELFGLAGPALSQSPGHPIAVAPIRASGRPDAAPLTIAGAPVQRPLVFHVSLAARAQRRDDALESCANAIAGLLDARDHRIGDRPLHPGDLAVLLPRNTDIERMRTLLAARRVPCVGAGKGSVFATDIACDLQVLLHGIEHAGDEGLVRAALATRFFGPGIADPRALRARFGSLHEHAQRFARWRQQWRHEGVLAVIQAVVADNAAHLAAGDDAERTLTDLRHLGELLQEQGAACDGPESLLAWFARQRGDDPDREAGEERLLRIESDIGRVQLMTLHASKGLQFPVVFLPLADADATRETKLPLVRRADGGRELDLGSEDHDGSVREAMFDEQDEAFRKLYVALTRAQYLCHVYAMDARSPRADPARAATSALLARLREGLAGRGLHAACAHIEWLAAATWPNAPHAYAPDPAPPVRARMARTPPAAREREGRYSFSLLAGQHAGAFEESIAADEQAGARDGLVADADRPAIEEPAHERLVALTAYRGERFGIALHAIFERRETGRPMRDQHALVRECLEEEGLRVEASAVADLATRVQAALEAPLLPDRADPPRLSALRDASMRTEMGFHYALDGVSMQRLREACARHGEPDLVPSQSSAQLLRGLMTGAIDLVFEHAGRFHVLDYKSNHLGERLGDYAPAALRARMDHHHYRFQALLYTVALDRYLRQRLRGYRREAQLGEAIYLFVRAAGLAPGAGVWSHRFDDALLAEVDDVLAGRRAEAEA